MGFLSDLLGKTAEKAARNAAAIQQGQEDTAQAGRIAAGEDFSGSADQIAQLFQNAPQGRGNDAFEQIAQLLGLRGTAGNETAIDSFRSTPGFEFAREEGEQARQRQLEAAGLSGGGRAQKEAIRFGQGLADQNSQQFIQNLFGLGNAESANESGRVANQANTQLRGAEGLLNTKTSAFGDRFRTASPTAQGVVAAANARTAGSQNLLNAGLSLAGTFAGGFGGGSGARPKFFPGEFNR